jgi:HPt (histidine-containing phosphotransfer) domain-containing protein
MQDGDAAGVPPDARFDTGRLVEISDGERDFELELAGEFVSQAWTLYGELTRAHETGDPSALRRAAHTLKGSSRTVGAEGVAEAAAELERAAAESGKATVAGLLARTQRLLVATERALDRHLGTDEYRRAA